MFSFPVLFQRFATFRFAQNLASFPLTTSGHRLTASRVQFFEFWGPAALIFRCLAATFTSLFITHTRGPLEEKKRVYGEVLETLCSSRRHFLQASAQLLIASCLEASHTDLFVAVTPSSLTLCPFLFFILSSYCFSFTNRPLCWPDIILVYFFISFYFSNIFSFLLSYCFSLTSRSLFCCDAVVSSFLFFLLSFLSYV